MNEDFNLEKDIYTYLIQKNKPLKLEEALDEIFEGKDLNVCCYKGWPFSKFYIKEDFNTLDLLKDRKEANEVYRKLNDYILKNVNQDERDLILSYKTYGFKASFPYDIDEKRQTSLKNKEFILNTSFGPLSFEFSTRDKYKQNDGILLCYEDELNKVVIFTEKPEVRVIDIINVLRKRNRFIHELTHYLDNIQNNWIKTKYNIKDDIEYLNSLNEFKANLQMILSEFGRYLFKNQIKYSLEDLKSNKKIYEIFQFFLRDSSDENCVDDEELQLFRKLYGYLNSQNKAEFHKQLFDYISNHFNTDKDFDLSESYRRKAFTYLLRLEENFV